MTTASQQTQELVAIEGGAASAAALMVTAAYAQPAPAGQEVEELVVTGTRGEARSRLESLSPVDVVTSASLEKQGRTELAALLAREDVLSAA